MSFMPMSTMSMATMSNSIDDLFPSNFLTDNLVSQVHIVFLETLLWLHLAPPEYAPIMKLVNRQCRTAGALHFSSHRFEQKIGELVLHLQVNAQLHNRQPRNIFPLPLQMLRVILNMILQFESKEFAGGGQLCIFAKLQRLPLYLSIFPNKRLMEQRNVCVQ